MTLYTKDFFLKKISWKQFFSWGSGFFFCRNMVKLQDLLLRTLRNIELSAAPASSMLPFATFLSRLNCSKWNHVILLRAMSVAVQLRDPNRQRFGRTCQFLLNKWEREFMHTIRCHESPMFLSLVSAAADACKREESRSYIRHVAIAASLMSPQHTETQRVIQWMMDMICRSKLPLGHMLYTMQVAPHAFFHSKKKRDDLVETMLQMRPQVLGSASVILCLFTLVENATLQNRVLSLVNYLRNFTVDHLIYLLRKSDVNCIPLLFNGALIVNSSVAAIEAKHRVDMFIAYVAHLARFYPIELGPEGTAVMRKLYELDLGSNNFLKIGLLRWPESVEDRKMVHSILSIPLPRNNMTASQLQWAMRSVSILVKASYPFEGLVEEYVIACIKQVNVPLQTKAKHITATISSLRVVTALFGEVEDYSTISPLTAVELICVAKRYINEFMVELRKLTQILVDAEELGIRELLLTIPTLAQDNTLFHMIFRRFHAFFLETPADELSIEECYDALTLSRAAIVVSPNAVDRTPRATFVRKLLKLLRDIVQRPDVTVPSGIACDLCLLLTLKDYDLYFRDKRLLVKLRQRLSELESWNRHGIEKAVFNCAFFLNRERSKGRLNRCTFFVSTAVTVLDLHKNLFPSFAFSSLVSRLLAIPTACFTDSSARHVKKLASNVTLRLEQLAHSKSGLAFLAPVDQLRACLTLCPDRIDSEDWEIICETFVWNDLRKTLRRFL